MFRNVLAVTVLFLLTASLQAQVTGTSLKSKALITSTGIIATDVFYTDGTNNVRGMVPVEVAKTVIGNITFTGGLIGLTTGTVTFTSSPVFSAATASTITLSGGGTGMAWLAGGVLSSTSSATVASLTLTGTFTTPALTLTGFATGVPYITSGVVSSTTTVPTLSITNLSVPTSFTFGSSTGILYGTSGVIASTSTVGSTTISGTLTATTLTAGTYGGNLVTSLTLTGSPQLFTVAGTTGALSLVTTTTGAPQFAQVGLNTSNTSNTVLYALTSNSTGTLAALNTGTSAFTGAYLTLNNSAANILTVTGSGTGGYLSIRNSSGLLFDVGTLGNTFFRITPTGGQQVRICTGAAVLFATSGESVSGNVSLVSNSSGILTVASNQIATLGTLQTGGFGGNFRAVSTSSVLTTTDMVVTLTGGITCTLPNATTLTGRLVIAKNIDVVTSTISGTASQTIDGNATSGILTSGSLRLISTGTNWISY